MLKRKIAILLAFALLVGSSVSPANAKEPDQNDEIYYWKVYSTDIAPGEEDQIEWINSTTWHGIGFSWASYWDLGYDTIEFTKKWGDNYVVGSNAKKLSERKVGDTFYYLNDGHLDNHERRLARGGWPLAKCTIMSILPFSDGSSMYNVDTSWVQAYKHIGYARSYNKDMFKKYELDKYRDHPTDFSLYFQEMTEAPTGDVTWVQDEGFQKDQKDSEIVTSIKVTGQPTLSYREGDKLDLSKLAVTLTYKNKSKKVVPYAEFDKYDLTTNLENGDPLYINRDNGKTIKIRKGSLKTETEPLAVGEALDASSPVKVDPVREGDTKISGQGETGADIVVKDQDGNVIVNTTVDKEGNWSANLPEDKTPTEGGKLTVTQTETGKAPTDTTVTVEKASNTSSEPQVNSVYDTDKSISGKGVSGASIVVTDDSNKAIGQTEVDSAGNWEVNLPDGKKLAEGDKLTVTQTEDNKTPTTVTKTVQKKETTKPGKPNDKDHKSSGGSSGGGSGFVPSNTDKNKATDTDKNKDNKQNNKDKKDNKSGLSIKDLNTRDHYRYMVGYEDKTFRPNREMTRAEVATMFVRLLDDKSASSSQAKTFKDVKAKDWYADLVAYASYRGIVSGYPDGTFKPNAPISRAEFASIAARFADLTKTEPLSFSDVAKTNWAYDSIAKAATKNWLSGYPDGTFRPDNKINRAEVTSITNRMLGRKADLDWIANNPGQVVYYKDVDKNAWWYGDIMEASNGHDYDKAGKAKVWTRLNHKSFA